MLSQKFFGASGGRGNELGHFNKYFAKNDKKKPLSPGKDFEIFSSRDS